MSFKSSFKALEDAGGSWMGFGILILIWILSLVFYTLRWDIKIIFPLWILYQLFLVANGSKLSKNTKFFVAPPFIGGVTFILAQKIQRGNPLAKKIFFIMKNNNMGIKSCVLMPLNTSWRDKIKISSVFSARAQKVSKMSEIPHFTHFCHFFGHYAKHRWYFYFYSSGDV